MIFCEKCFIDPEISARIKYSHEDNLNVTLEKGNCPICGSDDVYLYNTDYRTGLDDIFDPLLDLYLTEDKLPASFPDHEKIFLHEDLLRNWNLFNPKLVKADIESIVRNTSRVYCETNTDVFSKKVGISEKMNPDILSVHALLKAENWNDFIDGLKTKNRFHTNLINEDVLKKHCSFLEKKYKKGHTFYRGRISKNNSGVNISEMGAPPFELAKAGRANAEGISHLYLASDSKTTIHEVRAGAYDIITVGTFVLQNDIVIVDFQQLDKIYPFADGLVS